MLRFQARVSGLGTCEGSEDVFVVRDIYARHQSDKNSADPDYLDPSTRNPKSAKRTKLLPLLLGFVL